MARVERRSADLPRVLIVKCGSTEPSVVRVHGDYDDWFRVALSTWGVRFEVVRPYMGEILPPVPEVAPIILTGSPLSVRDEAPWMPLLGRWATWVARRTPVLAVCFGHQLVGEALGGRVDENPAGREIGTITLELTSAGRDDALFDGFSSAPRVHSTHADALLRSPEAPGVVRLAGTANTEWQVFSQGKNLRAVQFHPEIPEPALAALLAARDQEANIVDTMDGLRILKNWVDHFVRPWWDRPQT